MDAKLTLSLKIVWISDNEPTEEEKELLHSLHGELEIETVGCAGLSLDDFFDLLDPVESIVYPNLPASMTYYQVKALEAKLRFNVISYVVGGESRLPNCVCHFAYGGMQIVWSRLKKEMAGDNEAGNKGRWFISPLDISLPDKSDSAPLVNV